MIALTTVSAEQAGRSWSMPEVHVWRVTDGKAAEYQHAVGRSAMSDYTIDRGFGVRERMDLLAKVFGPSTGVLLDLVGVAEGARCVDLGCGAGHVAHELARRAGPTGAVIGIDLDAELLEVARAEAVRLNLPQVTFRVGAVEAALDVESVDLAYARMLVMHVRDPAQVVAAMVAAVCSGGVVVVEDLNFAGSFTFPPCVAFERRVTWYREAVRRRGGDADVGLRLAVLLRAAGLNDVGVRVAQPAYLDGPEKHLQELSMIKQRSAVLETGVASADDYDVAHADLLAFTNDPGTLVAAPRMIQAWGRRP